MAKQHRIAPRLVAAFALLGVAGCATDKELGAVNQHNIVAQAVDLDPQYAGVPIEGGSGQLSADAVNRYRKGAVKALLDKKDTQSATTVKN